MAEFKSFVVYFFDKIYARIPRGQEKFLCIVDPKGWGYANCDVRAYIAAIEIMQFVFIDDKSLKETLHREIDESQLLDMYGGNMALVPLKNYIQPHGGNMALVPLKNYMQPQAV